MHNMLQKKIHMYTTTLANPSLQDTLLKILFIEVDDECTLSVISQKYLASAERGLQRAHLNDSKITQKVKDQFEVCFILPIR